ncbi:MAG: NADP-dependent oxidoreductase [Sphingobium sp.]
MDEDIVVRVARMPPPGPLAPDVYEYRREPLKPLGNGEIRLETIYATIDAGARGMLDPASNYPMMLRPGNRVYTSAVVGRVVESRHPGFPADAYVRAMSVTRQKYLTIAPDRGVAVRIVDPAHGPLHAHIGALGMTGFTAWLGVFMIGQPRPGETMLVSAAAGAVGSVAGQLAKAVGARVVRIAGGLEKCAAVVERFGFDACPDYRSNGLADALARECPDGVDVYFENVGGAIQRLALSSMNLFGRVVMCGQVAQYDGSGAEEGPNLMPVVNKRLTMRGYISSDHLDQLPVFERGAAALVSSGQLRPCSTVTKGLDQLHAAVNSLTAGRNFGQQVHQMADDPAEASLRD